MIETLRLTGVLLRQHWPVLLAWFLFGTLGRYVAVEVAGFVGAYNETAGVILLPLAVLSRLVALVAMFLVLREGMSQLRGQIPSDAATRRREFFAALMAGILPFVAFYAARGYLREDVAAYLSRLLEVNSGIRLSRLVESLDESARVGVAPDDSWDTGVRVAGELVFSPVTIAIVIVAYSLRWWWGRYRDRLPKWCAIAAVYLELLWIYLSVTLVAQAISWVTGWIETRQGTLWLSELRANVSEWFEPAANVWEAVGSVAGAAGKVTAEPLAWLTIAGVIYGQAIAASAPAINDLRAAKARERYSRLPDQVRKRMKDVSKDLVSRFRPVWNALVLMWRAGPALIGAYVLLFAVLKLLEQLIAMAITRVIGPQDFFAFWMVADTLLFLLIPLLIEPARIALVAGTYNTTLERLPRAADDDEKSEEDRPEAEGIFAESELQRDVNASDPPQNSQSEEGFQQPTPER